MLPKAWPAFSRSEPKQMPEWRNRQTRRIQNPVRVNLVGVRVPPPVLCSVVVKSHNIPEVVSVVVALNGGTNAQQDRCAYTAFHATTTTRAALGPDLRHGHRETQTPKSSIIKEHNRAVGNACCNVCRCNFYKTRFICFGSSKLTVLNVVSRN